jgi:small-conductance mechanosensitive channel
MDSAQVLTLISDIAASVRAALPTAGLALLLVVLGTVVALVVRWWVRRLAERLLDRLGSPSTVVGRAVDGAGLRFNTPGLIAAFAFWIVILGFVAAAVEVFGLPVVTDLLRQILVYAPRLLAALLLAVGGLIAARLVRAATLRAAESMGIAQARGLAAASEAMVIVLMSVIVLEQLGVNGRVLELVVAIVAASVLIAGSLAFALGARDVVTNMIASHYVSRFVRVGQDIEVDGVRGTVIEVTSVSVVVRTGSGTAVVPARCLLGTTPVLFPDGE